MSEAVWHRQKQIKKLSSGYILRTHKQKTSFSYPKATSRGWLWKTAVVFDVIIVTDVLFNYGRITSGLFFLLFGWWF